MCMVTRFWLVLLILAASVWPLPGWAATGGPAADVRRETTLRARDAELGHGLGRSLGGQELLQALDLGLAGPRARVRAPDRGSAAVAHCARRGGWCVLPALVSAAAGVAESDLSLLQLDHPPYFPTAPPNAGSLS